MHPQGDLAGHDDDEQHHGDDQPTQFAIGPSIRLSTGMSVTILVAMGDEPLFLQGWPDSPSACPRPADAVPLTPEPILRGDEGDVL